MVNKKLVRAVIFGSAIGVSLTSAQMIDEIAIGKITSYLQTDAATTEVDTANGAYNFAVEVYGDSLVDPTVQMATGSTFESTYTSQFNGGVLGYNSDEDGWLFGSPNFDNWSESDKTTFDSLFANGTYSVTANTSGGEVTVDLDLQDPVDPYNITVFTLTGGQWVNGVYRIAADQTLGITTNAFTNFSGNSDGYMSIFMENKNTGVDAVNQEQLYSEDNSANNYFEATLLANTLEEGSYMLSGEFVAIVDKNLVDTTGLAYMGNTTTLSILVVPEPSAYAAIFGLAGLLCAAARRRR